MNILITSPSLNPLLNISGISSVVKTIVKLKTYRFIHYQLGREDSNTYNISWVLKQFFLPINFSIYLKKYHIDIVHINIPLDTFGVLRDALLFIISKSLGKKIVLHIHGGKFLTETPPIVIKSIIKSLFKYADLIIVLSDLEKKEVSKSYNCEDRINVLSNCVEDLYGESIKFFCQKPLIFTILFLGRIHESKGINEIINAFKILKKSHESHRFKFVLCGTGPLLSHSLVAFENILGDDFEYRGVVSGEEKIDIIKKADIFLLPSKFEGLPLSLLECMCAGVVPITTDVGSIKLVVNHNINGLIIKKEDPVGLSENIIELIKNIPLLCRLSANSRKTILDNFNVSTFHRKLSDIYSALL